MRAWVRVQFTAGAIGLMSIVPARAHASQTGAECPRPAKREIRVGDTIQLGTASSARCRLVSTETSVALRTAGTPVTDINRVYRAPDGRYYTVSSVAAEISVWTPKGAYVSTFGREGRGPGEFARGPIYLHFDTVGQVYARDNNIRWSVFGRGNRLLSSTNAAGMLSSPEQTGLLADLTFVTAGRMHASGPVFQVYDFSPERSARDSSGLGRANLVRAFGPDAVSSDAAVVLDAVLAPIGGTQFVAAVPALAPEGAYQLDQWNAGGHRELTAVRRAEWMREPRRMVGDEVRPPPGLVSLHHIGRHVIIAVAFVPKADWRQGARGTVKEREASMDRLADMYVDVIDLDAAAVLSSAGPLPRSGVKRLLGDGVFPGTNEGYSLREEADGTRSAVILRYSLTSQ